MSFESKYTGPEVEQKLDEIGYIKVAGSFPANGVYILHTNGNLYPRGSWDTTENDNAVGVAVLTDDTKFVIDKRATNSDNGIQWYNGSFIDIPNVLTTSDSTTAKTDFLGEANTTNIISSQGSGSYAAQVCRSVTLLNGKAGYLGAPGQWQAAYNNKSEVDACMSVIGGTAINTSYHWSSTEYGSDTAWMLYWSDGYVTYGGKTDAHRVRAFADLDAPPSLITVKEYIDEATAELKEGELPANGVYILDTDGNYFTSSEWNAANNDKAVGVAVLADETKFVIGKEQTGSYMQWGGYGTDISTLTNYSSESSAYGSDFDGEGNTDKIIAALGTSDTYAALACKNVTFPHGKSGYLGAAGQWKIAYDNKAEVDACMSAIGGEAILEDWHWSSSEVSSDYAWYMNWSDGDWVNNDKYNTRIYVRAFSAIPTLKSPIKQYIDQKVQESQSSSGIDYTPLYNAIMTCMSGEHETAPQDVYDALDSFITTNGFNGDGYIAVDDFKNTDFPSLPFKKVYIDYSGENISVRLSVLSADTPIYDFILHINKSTRAISMSQGQFMFDIQGQKLVLYVATEDGQNNSFEIPSSGYTTTSSLSSIDVTKSSIYATISSNQTLSCSATGADYNGKSIHLVVTSTSARTITLPTTGSYMSMSGSSVEVPANGSVEINMICMNGIWRIAVLESK